MSRWTHWAYDCSLDGCWVPVELDAKGEVETVVFGFSLLADKPPGKCVAIVHPDGQEVVEAWLATPGNREALEAKVSPVPVPGKTED